MDRKKIFLLIALFWLIIVVGFVAMKEYTLQTGEEILLKTQPVDPRDLFRGDYVILSYDISRLNLSEVESDTTEFKENDQVYITLENIGGYGIAQSIVRKKPSGGLFIKGKVQRDSSDIIAIEYGIESYFVPEGEGKEIEQVRSGSLDVRVAIDKNGLVGIKTLLLDGKEVRFD